ncbi:MAG: hypothetical protein IJ226_02660 [Clostridia bacterium]|nr:hypothetical protein [Clostridia bacterium]
MEKKILTVLLLVVLVLSVGLVALVGCNPDDITHFRLDLNDKDADYTQEYREANGLESKNIIKVVNKDLYKNFSTGLPKGSDMVAPAGKAFAGWYFDNTNFEGMEFSAYNWNKFQRDAADDAKKYVLYARWIPVGQQVVYFDLDNDKADFEDSYRKTHNNFTHRSPEFVVTSTTIIEKMLAMPKSTDVKAPSDANFAGWYFADDNTEFTPDNYLAHVEAGAVQMRVVARWEEKDKAYVYFMLPEADWEAGKRFDFKQEQASYAIVVQENFSEVQDALPATDSIIYHKFEKSTSEYVDYSSGNEFATFEWKIGVFDDDFKEQERLTLNAANWALVTAELDNYGTVYLVLDYTLKPEYEPEMSQE